MKIDKRIFVYAIFWSFIFTVYPWVNLIEADNFSDHFQTLITLSKTLEIHQVTLQSYIFEEKIYYIFLKFLVQLINFFRPEVYTEISGFPISNNVELSIKLVIFYIFLVWILFLFKKMSIIPAILLLIHPIAIDMSHSIIQTTFAYTFLIIGIFSKNKKIKYLTIFIAPLIHNSALLVAIIILVNDLIFKKLITSRRMLIIFFFVFTIGLFTPVLFLNIMIETGSFSVGKTLLTFDTMSVSKIFFYSLILILQLLHSYEYLKKHYIIIQTTTIIILLSIFTPFAFRITAGLWPLFVFSFWDMSKDKKMLALLLWIANLIFVYLVWTNKWQ